MTLFSGFIKFTVQAEILNHVSVVLLGSAASVLRACVEFTVVEDSLMLAYYSYSITKSNFHCDLKKYIVEL
jgi:hypothetical protein